MSTIDELRSRPGYIGVLAASKLVGRSKKTPTKWIDAGTLKAFCIGNADMIDRSYLADRLGSVSWRKPKKQNGEESLDTAACGSEIASLSSFGPALTV